MRITHVGTATCLLEAAGLRILTDPALDPAPAEYRFFPGLGSRKTRGPAPPPGGLGGLDLLLVSHDHHADNFDAAGRALLPSVGRALTTVSGARRLGGKVEGLAPWQTVEVANGLTVTATPARHGPAGIGLVDAETIGFLLRWPGQRHGAVWISGDTVLFPGIDEVAHRGGCGTAILHLGGVGFRLTGPARFTFDGAQAAAAAKRVGARTIVPVHYDGWTHFLQGRAGAEAAFAEAGVAHRVRWLVPGEPTDLDV